MRYLRLAPASTRLGSASRFFAIRLTLEYYRWHLVSLFSFSILALQPLVIFFFIAADAPMYAFDISLSCISHYIDYLGLRRAWFYYQHFAFQTSFPPLWYWSFSLLLITHCRLILLVSYHCFHVVSHEYIIFPLIITDDALYIRHLAKDAISPIFM